MNDGDRLLEYLQNNPTWHYGLDLCKALGISRGAIYIHLGTLTEQGLVDRRDGQPGEITGVVRPQYRITRSRGLPVGAVQEGT